MILPIRGATATSNVDFMSGMHDVGT